MNSTNRIFPPANAQNVINALVNLGVSMIGASKELKQLAELYTDLDMEKIKRKERYLRQYHNRGKRMRK